MQHTRSLGIGLMAGFLAAAVIGGGFLGQAGCQRSKSDDNGDSRSDRSNKPGPTPAPALPPQSDSELGAPLAKVDSVTITVGEFQERINRQSPYIRARYTSLEQKREFLDNMVRFEVLAKEALTRGFDKNPDVVRTMKQVMIQKLMKDEFENKLKPEDITDDEMRAFYKEHQDEYNKPEEVRVSAVIVKSKARAKTVAKDATGKAGSTNKGFRELVSKHSTDNKTKIRGGDLRYFNRQTKEVPQPVVKAAFGLKKTGDVAGPINAGNGTWYVIKQTGKRKAINKSFDTVKRQIQNRIYRDKRTAGQKQFIDGLRAKSNIKLFEKNLSRVRVDTSNAGAKHGQGGARPGGNLPAMPKAPPAPGAPKPGPK